MHQITPNFIKQEALFEFCALHGVHSGENMAAVTFSLLEDLVIELKLLAITSDNAPNNDTLVEHLHQKLLKQFDNKVDPNFGNTRPIMRFCGKQSCIRCIVHVLNRIVQKILAELKTGTAREY